MILWKLDDVMRRKKAKGREMARRMGIGENYLSRVRHEVPERLSLTLLDALCHELDCTIAELLESLGRPCEETALRKRQSRLASMAVVAGCERPWSTIDGYLKAKRRSYGGTPRKFPLMPPTVFFLIVVALTAAAWVVFSMSAAVCAVDRKPASNCDGAR